MGKKSTSRSKNVCSLITHSFIVIIIRIYVIYIIYEKYRYHVWHCKINKNVKRIKNKTKNQQQTDKLPNDKPIRIEQFPPNMENKKNMYLIVWS